MRRASPPTCALSGALRCIMFLPALCKCPSVSAAARAAGAAGQSAARALAPALFALAALVGTAMAETRQPPAPAPASEVRNVAVVSFTVGDRLHEQTAEATFHIEPEPETAGVLRNFRLVNGDPDEDIESFPFPPAPDDGIGIETLTEGMRIVPVVETRWLRLGEPLFIALDDDALNLDPAAIETIWVLLHESSNGTVLRLRLVETGPDSGVFTGTIGTTGSASEIAGGRLATRTGARITVRHADPIAPDRNLEAIVDVRSAGTHGRLFDSSTGAPLDGIAVTLIDMETGQPAEVHDEDHGYAWPATVVTGDIVIDGSGRAHRMAPGSFRFPGLLPGRYRLAVDAPEGFVVPSAQPDSALAGLPGAPFALGPGSRLDAFEAARYGDRQIDIPADPLFGLAGLRRSGSTKRAELGDFVEFTVAVDPGPADVVTLTDTLPAGLRFVAGSARLDGARVAPAVSADGRQLALTDRAVTPGRRLLLTYTAQVGLDARPGATLTSRSDLTGPAIAPLSDTHRLTVEDAFARDRIAILGQVVAGPCSAPEQGRDLSGIRLYLETGEFAVTDAEGRFSLRDIARRTHALQLDVASLPPGARPILCGNTTRRAGSATSQFIDVRPGLMGRAEFHIVFDPALEAAAAAAPDTPSAWRAPRSVDPGARFDAAWLHMQPEGSPPRLLFPYEGFQPDMPAVDVLYLRPQGSTGAVFVNGVRVPDSRRDPSESNLLGTLFLDRFTGVRLREGRNTITLVVTARDGTELLRTTHVIHHVTEVELAELLTATSVLVTDGRRKPVVEMRLTNRQGQPLRPGGTVSVQVAAPFAFAPVPTAPGAPAWEAGPQQATEALVGEDGVIRLVLAPVLESGTARFEVATRHGAIRRSVPISAADRPWFVNGLAEGVLSARGLREGLLPGGQGLGPASGRVAVFAEGMVRGDWLLTLRYDSARGRDDAFGGPDPDSGHIVYGDASWQGNAAESRAPLYLRLRKEGREYLLGDFDSDISTGLISLNRRLTGARAVQENDEGRLTAFVAPVDRDMVEDRIAANGTMGPYALSRTRIRQGSETVRLVVVARGDATRELSSERLVRGRDYVLDRAEGRLFLRRAIPAFTPELDRNILVVSYETEERLSRGWLAGARVEATPGEYLTLGATLLAATDAAGPGAAAGLVGLDITHEVTDALTVAAEVVSARKQDGAGGRIGGAEAEIRAEYDDGEHTAAARLRFRHGATGLDATGLRGRAGLATLDFSLRLNRAPLEDGAPRTGLFLDGGLRAEIDRGSALRRIEGEALLVRREVGVEYGAGFGLRHRDEAGNRSQALVMLAKAGWASADGRLALAMGSEAPVYTRRGESPAATAELSARFAASDTVAIVGTLQGRHAGDAAGIATAGVEIAPWDGATLAGGIAHAARAGESGAALYASASQRFDLGRGWEAEVGLDAQSDLGASEVPLGAGMGSPYLEGGFAALRVGLRQTAEAWAASADIEARSGEGGESAGLRLAGHGAVSEALTLGGAAYLGESRDRDGSRRSDIDIRLSAAHRDGPDDPITLVQLEAETSREDAGAEQLKLYGSVHHARYLSSRDSLTARYGAKFTESRHAGGRRSDVLNFVGAEYRRDLSETVDVGVHGALMHSAAAGSAAVSLGVSAGFTPFENAWLSLGYNVAGFRDADFARSGQTERGAFLQFRLKLDAATALPALLGGGF